MNERTRDMRHILDQIANIDEDTRIGIFAKAEQLLSNLENRADDLNLSLERAGYFDRPDLEDLLVDLFTSISKIKAIVEKLENH